MSWLRSSDTVAHDPRTLAPLDLEDADERTVDEVFGFSVRLAAEAASKETDRKVTIGMTRALAGSPARAARLMGMLVYAKVWRPIDGGWELINDPTYLHLRAQGEVDRDRIRAKDNRNDALTVTARLRDGDECRYCRKPVNWRDRKSLQGATWEHVNIANQPTQLHEFVVCCFECNREPATRGPLLPAPSKPVYGKDTKDYVKERLGKWPTRADIAERLGLRTSPESASGSQRTEEESAPDGLRTSPEHALPTQRTVVEHAAENARQNAHQRPENTSENAVRTMAPDDPDGPSTRQEATPGPDLTQGGLTDLTSSGRDGTSSSGSGPTGEGREGPPGAPPARSRRSRRRPPKPHPAPTSEV